MDINDGIHYLIDYIKIHYKDDDFASNLDKNIIRLSHEICKDHEEFGHLKRQSVRTILREKCESEVFKTVIASMIEKGNL